MNLLVLKGDEFLDQLSALLTFEGGLFSTKLVKFFEKITGTMKITAKVCAV
jgi:hypothetical protein